MKSAMCILLVLLAAKSASPQGKVIYRTDFSNDDGMIEVHRDSCEVGEGTLHLSGEDPGCHVRLMYGADSRTTFKLKLSRTNPEAFITVLWDPQTNTGHTAIVRRNHVHAITRLHGQELLSRFTAHETVPGEWHEVEIRIRQQVCQLLLDGSSVSETTLPQGMPGTGLLFLLARNSEIWIDDLRVESNDEAAFPSRLSGGAAKRPVGPEAVSPEWTIHTVVPKASIATDLFDVQVLKDGRIIVDGPKGPERKMVSVALDGTVAPTDIPWGGPFSDVSADGRIWFSGFPGYSGVFMTKPDGSGSRELFQYSPTQSPLSISVARDGSQLFLTLMDLGSSYLYRYRNGTVDLLAQLPHDDPYRYGYVVVEATDDGVVWVAGRKGLYALSNDRPVLVIPLRDFNPRALTFDRGGNLYIAAHIGDQKWVYRLPPGGRSLETVHDLSGLLTFPSQINIRWDNTRDRLLLVHKGLHQIYVYDTGGPRHLLKESMLSTPIAVAVRADGRVFVNGDELGVQYVDLDGKVHIFCVDLVCFQPPASDMVFVGDTLYYSGGAPGFPSFIYEIDAAGRVAFRKGIDGVPAGIDVTAAGDIVFADYANGCIRRYSSGSPCRVLVGGLQYPVGLVAGPDGSFYVSVSDDTASIDPRDIVQAPRRRILKIAPDGTREEVVRFEDSSVTFFDIDKTGVLYVPVGDRLLAVGPDGTITTLAQGFSTACDATIAPDGSVYLSDYSACALYRLVPQGLPR